VRPGPSDGSVCKCCVRVHDGRPGPADRAGAHEANPPAAREARGDSRSWPPYATTESASQMATPFASEDKSGSPRKPNCRERARDVVHPRYRLDESRPANIERVGTSTST